MQVTKVLSTAEVKRAIEGSGKDFGKSIIVAVMAEALGESFSLEKLETISSCPSFRQPRRGF
jgi:hypothetical protein